MPPLQQTSLTEEQASLAPGTYRAEELASSSESSKPSPSSNQLAAKSVSPVTHFSSLSIDYFPPSDAENPTRVSLQLIERDIGSADDFSNIDLDFIIRPRSPADAIPVSVDSLITLRHIPSPLPAKIRLHTRGAVPLGTFAFPNGPDACQTFLLALRTHIIFHSKSDPYRSGTLYILEAKPRMRRAAPSLMPLHYPQPGQTSALSGSESGEDDDFATLLSDLKISSSSPRNSKTPRQVKNPSPPHDFAISLLSQFARITQIARDAGDHIASLLDEDKRRALEERRRNLKSARSAAFDIHATITASTVVEDELPPRIILDSICGLPITNSSWRSMLDTEGRLVDPLVIKYAVFAGGIHPALRATLWPFLLGFYPWSSSASERSDILTQARARYATLKDKAHKMQQQAQEANARFQENVGTEAPTDRAKCMSDIDVQTLKVHEQIAKDIVRTDRAIDLFKDDDAPAIGLMGTLLNVYACYNPKISYCQGMSDFLAPLIHEIGLHDECLLFWCFEQLMIRMEANFRIDQSGMHAQLALLKKIVRVGDEELAAFFEETDPDYYACFRWIVVQFKRELPFEGTTRLWEALWSRQIGGDDLHIFVAAGLLFAHRGRLLALQKGAFDCLLRYMNDMSMRIDVDFAIREGEACYLKWGDRVSK